MGFQILEVWLEGGYGLGWGRRERGNREEKKGSRFGGGRGEGFTVWDVEEVGDGGLRRGYGGEENRGRGG
ncbi:uncharacterized protein G2W53_010162 [Senna tora]|uniref:Uncharacterized protein n=1 Tax=Senna tora TaxID=362788 RepID=A0A834X0K1_9FABA|nr:uncharacterized protein G2W53_010162 [Senna tora]